MPHTNLMRLAAVALSVYGLAAAAAVQDFSATSGVRPNLVSNIERALRYTPDGLDFVIENGEEVFNRPLYGGNTAFRADAGDRPEVVLYLPGRGGSLRAGFRTPDGAKWAHEAASIRSRYRPGAMLYEIRDPMLGKGAVLHLTVLASSPAEGVILRAALDAGEADRDEVELAWAYGGVNGERGVRDGDIGTERVPISQYFQLQPEFCRGNVFSIDAAAGTFTLRSRPATIAGVAPPGAWLAVADASQWGSLDALLASGAAAKRQPVELPVVVGRIAMAPGTPLHLALQRVSPTDDRTAAAGATALRYGDLPRLFAETDAHFRALRETIVVDTPDPYINAAAAALAVAADGVWDEPSGTVQHGAVAWRSRLLGWRGAYAMDALGWHDRARRHYRYWAGRQNTDPIPSSFPPPEEETNLARSRRALHSTGNMAASHYDMNLVFVDALFRHLLWTGDLDLARELWPVVERHLAWERRLFRRVFTAPDGQQVPLYEAYAAIWASDHLQYHGGGVAYASAYNWWHNTMAARLARLIGKDPAGYEREADAIARGMRALLWLPDQGMFGEFKDLLGLQRVHPNAGLWSFYHVLDAPGLVDPHEAWRMTRYVETQIPHLPVRGPGVPSPRAAGAPASFHVLSTTSWMPYGWSVNNVVMGENVHAALGYWQAGRAEEAYRITKGALLAAMYMGICPGNVGSMSYLDVYRRESQRDFADGSGALSRALVEGLFGVKPDALAGELRLEPGFPAGWNRARLEHPDLNLALEREGSIDRWLVAVRRPVFETVRFRLPARRARLTITTADGRAVPWSPDPSSYGRPWITFTVPVSDATAVTLAWEGEDLPAGAEVGASVRGSVPEGMEIVSPASGGRFARTGVGRLRWAMPVDDAGGIADAAPRPRKVRRAPAGQHDPVDLAAFFNDRVTGIFRPGKYRSPRSPYVSLAIPAQGIGGWAGHVNATAVIDDEGLRAVARANGGRLVLPDGVLFATPGAALAPNVVFTSQWDNYPAQATVPLGGRARHLHLLMAGSTNHMQSRFDNGEVVVAYADGTSDTLVLHNPTNWWPIDQDYFIDDYQFRRPEPIPPRVDLKTGRVRILDAETFKGQGQAVPGGAATVLELPLDPGRELRSLTVRALANEVVIGLMAATLER